MYKHLRPFESGGKFKGYRKKNCHEKKTIGIINKRTMNKEIEDSIWVCENCKAGEHDKCLFWDCSCQKKHDKPSKEK